MNSTINKLDASLIQKYKDFINAAERGENPDNPKQSVLLITQATDKVLEEIGMRIIRRTNKIVRGEIELSKLADLAKLDEVLDIDSGQMHEISLDTSVREIKARYSPPTLNGVWSELAGIISGDTGQGIAIGIIDSGIDFTHPDFFASQIPISSRIAAIWDPGLNPVGTENSPLLTYMANGERYGVEYKKTAIDTHLQSATNPPPAAIRVRHRDCNGHGTHVASIAAGNGNTSVPVSNISAFDYMGVAPKAHLIIVKTFFLENDPVKSDGVTKLSSSEIFEDAIRYIKKVAELDLGDIPVVINYSAGTPLGPHDGLTPGDLSLEAEFSGTTGKAFVAAAGNQSGKDLRAQITIPVGGTIEIDVMLSDTRTNRTTYDKCRNEANHKDAFLDFWYSPSTPNTMEFSVKPPGEAYSSVANMANPNRTSQIGGITRCFLFHSEKTTLRGAVSVKRGNMLYIVKHRNGVHLTGVYKVKFTGTPGAVIHGWALNQQRQGFKFINGNANYTIVDQNMVDSPGSAKNVIGVAAYDDLTGSLTTFSGLGPLMDYSGLGVYTAKPDLAAPGLQIKAAESDFAPKVRPPLALPVTTPRLYPHSYVEKRGTSMSAPHITGVVALMLQKNPALTIAQIISLLNTHARLSMISGMGAGMVDAFESHQHS